MPEPRCELVWSGHRAILTSIAEMPSCQLNAQSLFFFMNRHRILFGVRRCLLEKIYKQYGHTQLIHIFFFFPFLLLTALNTNGILKVEQLSCSHQTWGPKPTAMAIFNARGKDRARRGSSETSFGSKIVTNCAGGQFGTVDTIFKIFCLLVVSQILNNNTILN